MKIPFLGLGKETLRLQLYGKLPVAKDYLRLDCAEGSGLEFRDFLDRTFGGAAGSDLSLGEPLRFLTHGSKEPLVGVLWPSTDAGGLRSFPFTLFVARRRKAVLADLAAGLSVSEAMWADLTDLREECLQAADGREVLDRQRGRELTSREGSSGAAADLDTWVETLWPDRRGDGLRELVARIDELVGGGYRGPWRMPLVRELPFRDQVFAWLELLKRARAVEADRIPTLYFPQRTLIPSSEPAFVLVGSEPLGESEVQWLAPSEDGRPLGEGDFAAGYGDLPSVVSAPDARAELRSAILTLLEREGA